MCIAHYISNPQLTTVIFPDAEYFSGFLVTNVSNTLVFVCYYNEWKKQPLVFSVCVFVLVLISGKWRRSKSK